MKQFCDWEVKTFFYGNSRKPSHLKVYIACVSSEVIMTNRYFENSEDCYCGNDIKKLDDRGVVKNGI